MDGSAPGAADLPHVVPVALVPPPTSATAPASVYRDSSFWGVTVTQYLGAFNDNLYKQLVLLWAVSPERDAQGFASALFALPFVMFSGLAGFLADRNSKRSIVLLCKQAEIVIMFLALLAFAFHSVNFAFAVLFLMGTHSAFFGPPKYGILPELFVPKELPLVNGIIQMTTFLAIILGTASAGILKEHFNDSLWVASAVCMLIALVGTATATLIRRTPIAQPHLPFHWSSLAVSGETFRTLRRDWPLVQCLILSAIFFFVGLVVMLSVNSLGKVQLEIGDRRTSLINACMAIGIAVGCGLSGKLSAGKICFRLVAAGACGIVVCLGTLSFCGFLLPPDLLIKGGAHLLLTLLGIASGIFIVPINVFLQSRPPIEQKGRVIGAMNLTNWLGIGIASLFYGTFIHIFHWTGIPSRLSASAMFAATCGVMLLVAIVFRPGRLQSQIGGSASA